MSQLLWGLSCRCSLVLRSDCWTLQETVIGNRLLFALLVGLCRKRNILYVLSSNLKLIQDLKTDQFGFRKRRKRLWWKACFVVFLSGKWLSGKWARWKQSGNNRYCVNDTLLQHCSFKSSLLWFSIQFEVYLLEFREHESWVQTGLIRSHNHHNKPSSRRQHWPTFCSYITTCCCTVRIQTHLTFSMVLWPTLPLLENPLEPQQPHLFSHIRNLGQEEAHAVGQILNTNSFSFFFVPVYKLPVYG